VIALALGLFHAVKQCQSLSVVSTLRNLSMCSRARRFGCGTQQLAHHASLRDLLRRTAHKLGWRGEQDSNRASNVHRLVQKANPLLTHAQGEAFAVTAIGDVGQILIRWRQGGRRLLSGFRHRFWRLRVVAHGRRFVLIGLTGCPFSFVSWERIMS
jgi:hypothetical protein